MSVRIYADTECVIWRKLKNQSYDRMKRWYYISAGFNKPCSPDSHNPALSCHYPLLPQWGCGYPKPAGVKAAHCRTISYCSPSLASQQPVAKQQNMTTSVNKLLGAIKFDSENKLTFWPSQVIGSTTANDGRHMCPKQSPSSVEKLRYFGKTKRTAAWQPMFESHPSRENEYWK